MFTHGWPRCSWLVRRPQEDGHGIHGSNTARNQPWLGMVKDGKTTAPIKMVNWRFMALLSHIRGDMMWYDVIWCKTWYNHSTKLKWWWLGDGAFMALFESYSIHGLVVLLWIPFQKSRRVWAKIQPMGFALRQWCAWDLWPPTRANWTFCAARYWELRTLWGLLRRVNTIRLSWEVYPKPPEVNL